MKKRVLIGQFFLALIAIELALLPLISRADSEGISVVYPDVSAPYQVIMREIMDGISDELGSSPDHFVVPDTDRASPEFQPWLSSGNRKLIIALGQRSFQAVYKANVPVPLLLGAVLSLPEEINKINPQPIIISYTPAPDVFFQKLRSFSPEVKNVVVLVTAQDAWFVPEAKQAASRAGLNLKLYETQNLQASARIFKEILSSIDKNTAIWITHNTQAVDDSIILPLLLKEAWDKNIVIFSSRLAHADKGALFVLYPDNYALGKRLARMGSEIRGGQYQGSTLQSLQDLKIAVNLRTANHLGLDLSSQSQRNFDLVFPKGARLD